MAFTLRFHRLYLTPNFSHVLFYCYPIIKSFYYSPSSSGCLWGLVLLFSQIQYNDLILRQTLLDVWLHHLHFDKHHWAAPLYLRFTNGLLLGNSFLKRHYLQHWDYFLIWQVTSSRMKTTQIWKAEQKKYKKNSTKWWPSFTSWGISF